MHRGLLGRRSLLAGLAALGAAGLVGCNASAGGSSDEASPTGAARFSYTDARGKVVEFDLPATGIVAQSSVAATLLDFGYQVAGVYGDLKPVDGKLSYQAGDLDLSKVTVLADVYGEFDVEKLAAMNPQVVIDLMFVKDELWYLPDDLLAKVEKVCPTIAMEMLDLGLVEIINDFAELSGKLGADLNAPLVTDAKKAFDDATAQAKEAIAAKPGLTVVGISRTADQVWITNANQAPDLAYWKSLGAKMIDHGGKPDTYFTEISYEQLDKFSADIIYDDSRAGYNEAADNQPTWRALPAVRAGQVVAWRPAAPYSWKTNAPILTEFATTYAQSQKVT
ncbi:putative iron-siderophore ABC transporter substrate-binding protein [Microlunatus phosphovorus NM-1]|uniref:Putative iron-siderophore ABC transporter substrate-binding protein n=1 Tax=Microlunatus phosphovorus (strain ATCC 700054 / DSM 10555 / JCM 9379 / NBRC 101784 / NCIMB 13414 / VKM Ac-1990 / NM-1) TaxID=1032480 RepID=F5XG50_MICPN|nr:ABC transporter substrate-binding protein [Microlunatus phosphovorus]BAK37984.1 putative iron-siderophore ABC transporter substrate-binding protein [Microlunatus phosphovorus NM-1]